MPNRFRQNNNCPPIPGQVWSVCLWRSNTFGNHGDSLGSGQTFNTTTISHLQDNDNNSTTSKTSSAQLELIREDLVYRSVVSSAFAVHNPTNWLSKHYVPNIIIHLCTTPQCPCPEPPISVDRSTMSTRVCPPISKYLLLRTNGDSLKYSVSGSPELVEADTTVCTGSR